MLFAGSKFPSVKRSTVGAILFAALVVGCASDELTGTFSTNRPPTVWLAIAPPESSTVDYQVEIFWGGFDSDGNLSHFEYAISNNESGIFDPADTTGADKWHTTKTKDSLFVFSADHVADSTQVDFDKMRPYEFMRSHTFFVRAVDEQGAQSDVAHRSFTARNLSPEVIIELPRTVGLSIAHVAPMITFQWVARDYVGDFDERQDPDSVRSILVNSAPFGGDVRIVVQYLRENPDAPEWTDWVAYDAPDNAGRTWRPDDPMAYGNYVFAVQAKDEAGAVTPVFDVNSNVVRIRVNNRITGPSLIVFNEFLGRVTSATVNSPVNVLNLPADVPVSFTFSADASHYGGSVTGYRYGWDILDLNEDEQWETTFTPFVGSTAQSIPRRFQFGTHTFYIETIDNSGFKSRVTVRLNIIPFSMQRPVLVIDDWFEGSNDSFFFTNGLSPGDQEHDDFWAEVMSDVSGFSPDADMIPLRGLLQKIPITLLASYKAVIWNTRTIPTKNTTLALLDEWIEWGTGTNFLAMYMAAGGKVLLCGDHAMSMSIDKNAFPSASWFYRGPGPAYPLIFRYEIDGDQFLPLAGQEVGVSGVGETSFAYKECCLNVLDVTSGVNWSKPRPYCKVRQVRDYRALAEGLRTCLPIDETYEFPQLELRPEVAAPGRFFHGVGLRSDIFNPPYFESLCSDYAETSPPRDCFQPMYGLGCNEETSVVFGAPVAYWTSALADVTPQNGVAGRSAVWGFSPVYFKPDQVREALNIMFFDEWQIETRPVNLSEEQ